MDLTNATTIQGQSLQKHLNTKQMQASNSIASLGNSATTNGASLPVPGLSSLQLQPKTSLTSQAPGSNQVSQTQLHKIKSKQNISLGLNGLQAIGNEQKYQLESGPAYISYDMKIGDVSKYNFRGASSSHAAGSQSQTSIQGRTSSQERQVESNLLNRRISQQRTNGETSGDTTSKPFLDNSKFCQLSSTHEMAKRSQKRFQPNYNTTTNGGITYTEGNDSSGLPRLSGNSIVGQATAIGVVPNSVTNDSTKTNQLTGNTRKMSLAAKSGQMQVFNSLQSQNLNSAAAPPLHPGSRTGNIVNLQGTSHSSHGARTTMTEAVGSQLPPRGALNLGAVDLLSGQPTKLPIPAYGQVAAGTQRGAVASLPPSFKTATSQKTTIYSNSGATTGQTINGSASVKASGQAGCVLGGIENTAQERMKMNSGGGVGLGERQDDRAVGVRQFESYLARRQIIQQQREKKQELLKQLDQGMVNKSERNNASGLDSKENNQVLQQNAVLEGLRVEGVSQQQPLKPGEMRKAVNQPINGVQHGHSNSMSAPQSNLFSERTAPIGVQSQYTAEGHQASANQAAVQLEYNTTTAQTGAQLMPNSAALTGPTSSAGMYYSSISPTRAQKYLMHQHQQQRGPVPLALSNMSNSVQAPVQSVQSTKHLPETSLIKIQSGQDQFNNAILARNRFKGSIIHSTQANILPIQMNLSTGQPLGSVDSNIFIAPHQQKNGNDFSQYLQYQMQSPTTKMAPIHFEQASLQQQMYNLQQQQAEKTDDSAHTEQPRKDVTYARPHKIYDYMFIQMSNEMFQKEYAGRKILVTGQINGDKEASNAQSPKGVKKSPNKTPEKGRFASMPPGMVSPTSNANGDALDLNGIVKIKAYESQLTDELPQVQCNLQPTQLDHLKVLVCEQEDKNHPKLTADAQNRFEIEKQNQIKQYMEDIIAKLQQKERRFKVTVKRKFVDDALYNSTQIRVASVYVIVINRDKTYDPLLNQRFFKSRKRISNNKMIIESSSEDEEIMLENMDPAQREEYLKQQRMKDIGQRRSANSNLVNCKKRSLYDSDNGYSNFDNMNSTSTSTNMPNFKKLMQEKSQNMSGLGIQANRNGMVKQKRIPGIQTGPNLRRNIKKDDEFSVAYKYTPPVKDFSKYGPAKIKICQDVKAHSHHHSHPINVFFNQFNEFIKIVLKNQKLQNPSNNNSSGPVYKFNYNYAFGLARALGMQLKKDAFSESNMKSREYVNSMKEKLIVCMWRKLNESNKDLTPAVNDVPYEKMQNEEELRVEAETIDSSNNTPKSKTQLNKLLSGDTQANAAQANPGFEKFAIQPPTNTIYKYFIGKGNNSIMVRSLFKNRYWWVQHDRESLENCNFCWTQIRKVNIMEALQCKYPTKKSGIKNVNYNPKVEDPPGSAPGNMGMSSILATPQQKSGKKKRQASQSLQASDKGSKLDNSASATVEVDGITASAGCAIYKGSTTEKQSDEQFIKKMIDSKLYNKIEDNFHLNNKKALFLNMKNYYEALEQDVFDHLPITFHVKSGLSDPEFERFKNFYYKTEENIKNKKAAMKQKKKEQVEQKKGASSLGDVDEKDHSPSQSPEKKNAKEVEEKEIQYYTSPMPARNIWIIKPGENTNRGHGIQVARDFDEIKNIIADSTTGGRRTCIVQKYIHNPLLIHRRKFDIRTFVLVTSVNGNLKVYIYEEGYLRTSCREYSIHNLSNKLVHLTNDAVQKRAEDYGKFEPGNKLSYNEFQMFIDKNYPDLNICFERDIKPQMNKMTTDIFRACYNKLDPKRRLNCMEVFGLDFMIDDEFRSYLIEVNTNPCLELSCPLLARLIPNMLENALKIGLDSQFLPPEHFSSKKAFIGDACPENRFELVFDINIDGPVLDNIFKTKQNIIIEMDEDELSEEEEHDDE